MPSFVITVNKTQEIRVNLPASSSIGANLSWVGGDGANDEGYIFFHVGGVDGEEVVSWGTPELSVGDEITIKISEDAVVDSPTTRNPHKKTNR